MDIYAFPPVAAVLGGAEHLLATLVAALSAVIGPSAAAASIILITVLVRAALVPLGIAQVRGEFVRARLAPEIRRLRERHSHDPARMQRELSALYARNHASPFSGCLPLAVQAPVLSILYALFLRARIGGGANALLAHGLAGVPLGTRLLPALATGTASWQDALVIGGLLVVLAGVIQLSRRMLARTAPAGLAADPGSPAAGPAGSAGPAGAGSGVGRMLAFLPFATVAFAAFVPLAAVLYLLTSTAWTAAERPVLRMLVGGGHAGPWKRGRGLSML